MVGTTAMSGASGDRAVRRRTACISCPLRRLPVFRAFTPSELEFIGRFKTNEIHVPAGHTIVREGEENPSLYTLLDGWAFRHKALPDDRRQIVGFSLPGDFLGLQGQVFGAAQHSIEALTPAKLCVFHRSKLWELFNSHPELGFDVAWLSARSEGIVDEHLLAVGQRSASERIAYLFLHLLGRCRSLAMTTETRFAFPGTQQHIADALGLSLVHTNKTLRRLQASGLIRWTPSCVEVLDERRLRLLAHYDEDDTRVRPLL